MQEPPITNSYFVFFKTQKAAAAAAQCSIFPEGAQDAFKVIGAPGPEEVRRTLYIQHLSYFLREHTFLSHAYTLLC